MDNPLAVLIVEDSESDAQLIVRLLKTAGYEVISEQVESAEQMRFALEGRAWDVVISDYNLPQFNGRAALELLKEKQADIPFIVVSGTIGEEIAVAMMKAGAHDYLMKGDLARFIPAVKRELEQTRDRRERKLAEEALRESESFTQAILKNSPIGISVRSRTGQLLSANEAWKKIWAISESDLQNDLTRKRQALNFDERDEYMKFYQEDLRRVYEQGEHLYLPELKTTHSRPGGAEWISQHFYAIRDARGQVTRVVILTEDITERKLAHEVIQESEERLAAVMEGSQLGYSDWNIQTGEVRRNERWAGMLGYDLRENKSVYQQWEDLIHPDDRASVLRAMQEHLDGKTVIHRNEYRLRMKDGSYRWILDQGKIVEYDPHGRPLRMTATHTDITERKHSETERQTFLEIMQGLVVTKDLHDFLRLVHDSIANVIYAENFFVVLFNKDTGLFEEVYSVDKFDPPGAPSKLEKSISAYVFRSGQPHLMTQARFDELAALGEVELVGSNSLSWLGAPLKTSNETIGVMVVQDYETPNRYSERDIDFLTSIAGQVALVVERKQTEDQLRQLSRAVEQSPASIIITDVDGNIEYVNPKFTSVNGYTLAEVRGKTPRILKSDKTPPEVYPVLWQSILSGKEWHGEFLNRKKNGEHYWEYASISAIADSKGNITHFIAVNEDITARKESEEKIHLLNLELERQALTDYLTNLYNRRYIMQRGVEEFKRANRNRQPLSLLMLDIDEFKKVNDIYGHEAGDVALQQVSAALKSSLRETDILGRVGGEEFAVLLPNTSLEEAILLAERVRHATANTSFETGGETLPIIITICIGVAAFENGMSSIDDMFRNADAALYRAKHNGRNRVMKYVKSPDETSFLSSGLDGE